jgi:secreted trypsin-like serine protease
MTIGRFRAGMIAVPVLVSLLVASSAERPASALAERPVPAPSIVGGAPVDTGTWPWLASIVENLGAGQAQYCSGTVVAPNLVLTAAHCVEDVSTRQLDQPTSFTVHTGNVNWTAASAQSSGVTQLITHATNAYVTTYAAGETGINVVGDAALLELAKPTTAPAIALADSSDLDLLDAGTMAQIAGWGLTDAAVNTLPADLQSAHTVVQSTTYCDQSNSTFSATAELCAINAPADNTSACNGDSGGPLVAQASNGKSVEIGVASTTLNDCDTALPDFYTRADYIEPWVEQEIAALPATPPDPSIGKYAQRKGHISVTLGAAGADIFLTHVKLEFVLRCADSRRRGPFTETAPLKDPLSASTTGRDWTGYARFRDRHGRRYAITAAFTTTGATGTLSVTTRNGRCSTGVVSWTATTPRRSP